MIILIGIIMMMVGWVLRSVMFHIDDNDVLKWIFTAQDLMIFLGVGVMSLGLFHGSIKNESIPDNIRMAMMIAAGIIVGLVAANSSALGGLLNALW